MGPINGIDGMGPVAGAVAGAMDGPIDEAMDWVMVKGLEHPVKRIEGGAG